DVGALLGGNGEAAALLNSDGGDSSRGAIRFRIRCRTQSTCEVLQSQLETKTLIKGGVFGPQTLHVARVDQERIKFPSMRRQVQRPLLAVRQGVVFQDAIEYVRAPETGYRIVQSPLSGFIPRGVFHELCELQSEMRLVEKIPRLRIDER